MVQELNQHHNTAKIRWPYLWVTPCAKHLTNFPPCVSTHDRYEVGLKIVVLLMTIAL